MRLYVAAVLLALSLGCGDRVPRYELEPFAADAPLPGPLGGLLVVTNFGDDTLSAIDPVTRAERWRIPVGFIPVELEGPHHVTADPAGRFLYVNLSQTVPGAGSGPHGAHGTGDIPGFLVKLDSRNGRLVAFASVDRNPGDNLVAPDGRTIYVSHYDLIAWTKGSQAGDLRQGDSRIAFVDAETMAVRRMAPVCPAAHGMALSADGRTLFVACATDAIAVLDTADENVPARRVQLPGSSETGRCEACPYAVAVMPDGRVWVASLGPSGGTQGRGRLDLFDPATGTFDPTATVRLRGRALFPAFGPDGAMIVPEQAPGGDGLRIYRPAPVGAPVEEAVIPLPASSCVNAHAVHPTARAGEVIVVCEGDHRGSGTLVWVDIDARQVTTTVPVGVFPDDVETIPASAP